MPSASRSSRVQSLERYRGAERRRSGQGFLVDSAALRMALQNDDRYARPVALAQR